MKKPAAVLLAAFLILSHSLSKSQTPVVHWDFERMANRSTVESIGKGQDTIEGNFRQAPGVLGWGLSLDGFTTCLRSTGTGQPSGLKDFSVDAWVALGEYPLNWCPILTSESDQVAGYRLMIGPSGQASFQCAIGGQWISCSSPPDVIPLRRWMHLAGVYRANSEMTLYVNGEASVTVTAGGPLTAARSAMVLGMTAQPEKPSDIIRTWGTVAQYFGLDGILDEVKIYDVALTAGQVRQQFSKIPAAAPAIPERRLPTLAGNPQRFGAFYTKLSYYPGWDSLWPVDQDPDIVVCFDRSPVRLVFWRGIRYGPCWVSENERWMADQSLETWGTGENDTEGCFEHMQDRHCRFSHVRIIENSEARVVVHWRYAPVSAWDNTWLPDPKTGWECWVDEYYYVYPDGSAIRKVSWNRGTTGNDIQYQETLPLTQPGQRRDEVIENEYVQVADYGYNKVSVLMEPARRPSGWTGNYTIQQFNFKSENKPFICFEPGNSMWIRWIGGGYNHFPVNQARSDGRWAKTTDRPTHFASSPCSDPVIHEQGNRLYWIGLYGMNTMSIDELIAFGRSWAYSPELVPVGRDIICSGYDRSQRCYQLENLNPAASSAELTLKGTRESPVVNPAFVIKNWKSGTVKVWVNGKTVSGTRSDIHRRLTGDDLVVYIPIKAISSVKIRITT